MDTNRLSHKGYTHLASQPASQVSSTSHELEPSINSPLSNTLICRIDQTDESDLHFLTRLGKEHDAIAKLTNRNHDAFEGQRIRVKNGLTS